MTVNAGATLSGHGAIVGSVINNGGAISPGGSIGTLTVHGNLTMTSGSMLSIEVTPTTNSTLAVTGTANLAGSVLLAPDPGIYRKGATYAYLTAGSVTGSFSSVTASGGLQLTGPNLLTGTAILLNGSFTNAAATANQTAVGTALVGVPVGAGDFDTIANALVGLPTAAEQNAALDQLGGEIYADFLTVGRDTTRSMFGGISDQLSADGEAQAGSSGHDVWGRTYGRFGTVKGDGDAHKVSDTSVSVIMGATGDWGPAASAGVALGYGHTDLHLQGLAQQGDFDTVAAVLYGERRAGAFFLDAAASLAYDHGASTRVILFPGVARTAAGSFSGYAVGAFATAGARLGAGAGVLLEPSATLTYSHVRQDGFTEAGGVGADLSGEDKSQNALESIAQLKVSKSATLANGSRLRADIRAAWTHEWNSTATDVTQAFAAPGSDTFPLAGADPGKNAGVFGVGLAYDASDHLALFGRYDATVGRERRDAIAAGFKLKW